MSFSCLFSSHFRLIFLLRVSFIPFFFSILKHFSSFHFTFHSPALPIDPSKGINEAEAEHKRRRSGSSLNGWESITRGGQARRSNFFQVGKFSILKISPWIMKVTISLEKSFFSRQCLPEAQHGIGSGMESNENSPTCPHLQNRPSAWIKGARKISFHSSHFFLVKHFALNSHEEAQYNSHHNAWRSYNL